MGALHTHAPPHVGLMPACDEPVPIPPGVNTSLTSVADVEALLGTLVARIADYAILLLDASGYITSWNAGAERFKGYKAAEIIGRHFSSFYPPEDIAAGKPERELLEAMRDGRIEDEGWRVRKDGSRFWANVVITALYDADGALRGFGKVTRDLSERRAAEVALRASEERFRLLVDSVTDYAILMLDADGYVATWNAGAQRFIGYTAAEIIGRHFSTFYPAEDVAAGKPTNELVIATAHGRLEDEGWRVRKDGSQFWANVVITALRDSTGTLRGFGKVTRDLTERRNYERRLEHMADHDPLTGMLNRRSFARELESQVARVARYGPTGAVLMLDLDNFKHYNDTHGHRTGDELLVRIAHGIKSRLRASDSVARLGGDEFAVLLTVADAAGARAVADAIVALVRREPVPAFTSVDRRVTASIGIARFDDGERLTPQEMLVNADRAMYAAKEGGRNRVVHYRPAKPTDAGTSVMNRSEQIRAALQHAGFVLFAQPIAPLRGSAPTQFELLLRMRDADGSLVMPAQFLPTAERSGLSEAIDYWVAASAVTLLAEHRAAHRDTRLWVNLTGLTMRNDAFVDNIAHRLADTGVPPDRLIFEVSETAAVADLRRAVTFAGRLAHIGCGFAIDNFGATFGSFYYAKHLSFDYVKIDREYVRNCVQNETDRILIAGIAQIARRMGKRTVAECVESADALTTLTGLGVDYAQGFQLGVPAPLSDYLMPQQAMMAGGN